MITILVVVLVTTLGFGGLMALRYGRTGSRVGLFIAAAIAVETIALQTDQVRFLLAMSNQVNK